MRTYDVEASLDGTWWTFEISALVSPSTQGEGHRIVAMGQSRRAAAIAQDARDLAALWTGEAPENVSVDVHYKDYEDAVRDAEESQNLDQQGRRLIERAAELRREAVTKLRERGLSQADTAAILGISRQRVQQLEHGYPSTSHR